MSATIASDFARFATSEIFELTAQQGQLRFLVHKDILAAQSQPLRDATTGEFKETAGRKINLEDWDGDTVGRLVEFLYTDNYQYPDPAAFSSGKQKESEKPKREGLMSPKIVQEPNNKSKQSPDRPLTPLNEYLDGILPPDQKSRETDQKRLERFSPLDDYKDTLLSHAKVYCLAHHKSISSLQVLALKRLFMTLIKVNPLQSDSCATLNFIDLVKYVYSHTDLPVNSEEPLRGLISQFAALNIQALQRKDGMTELTNEGGDFVNELMPKVSRRAISGEKNTKPKVEKENPTQTPTPTPTRTLPNPVIGYFNTGEVHDWSDPWGVTSKIRFFGTTYSAPPGMPIGLNSLDAGDHNNIRVNAFASNIGRDRFTINIDSWDNSLIYSAGCAWLEIQNNDPDFQFGSFCTLEDHINPETRTSRLIAFPRAYAAPPTVVVWLAKLDIEHHTIWRVKTYVTAVTATNFVLHIDTWDNTLLHSATASWVAYPPNIPKVASGRFSTSDVRSMHPAQLNTNGHVSFKPGVFDKPPHVLLAIDYLDIDCCQNMRFRLDYSSMTTAGMNWHISSWENTVLYALEASYIALG